MLFRYDRELRGLILQGVSGLNNHMSKRYFPLHTSVMRV